MTISPEDYPPSVDDIEDRHTLPCGCVFGSYRESMVFIPHDVTCEYYQFSLQAATARRKPIGFSGDLDNV